MRCDDFVMLGTTVPEPHDSGRVFVCSAGYSHELNSLIRIYPLAPKDIPRRWHKYQIELERNPKDSRPESWQIAGERNESHGDINARFVERGCISASERDALVERFSVESIDAANSAEFPNSNSKMSLAIIRPDDAPSLVWEATKTQHTCYSPQLSLFETPTVEYYGGAKRFPYIPRLHFRLAGAEHRLMLRDWGCFEYMRKYGPQRENQIGDNLRLQENPYLLIGNLNNQRTAWLVISAFSASVGKQKAFAL